VPVRVVDDKLGKAIPAIGYFGELVVEAPREASEGQGQALVAVHVGRFPGQGGHPVEELDAEGVDDYVPVFSQLRDFRGWQQLYGDSQQGKAQLQGTSRVGVTVEAAHGGGSVELEMMEDPQQAMTSRGREEELEDLGHGDLV
jgi:hypothetical protein